MNQKKNNKKDLLKTQSMNLFNRIIGALFRPIKTFSYLNMKPDWWRAMCVIIIASILVSILYIHKTDLNKVTEIQLKESGSLEKLPDDQRQSTIKQHAQRMKYTLLLIPLILPIGFLIQTGILYFIFRLFKGGITFKKAFSMVSYSHLPLVIERIIAAIVLLLKSVNEIPFNRLVILDLTVFLVREQTSRFLWNLAYSMCFFSIWSLILLCIGMAAINNLNRRKSFIIVISFWLLWTIVNSFLGSL
jgi:hypothetical protein